MKSQPSEGDSVPRPDDDTEAILSRRKFLIASALAGAGIGVGATGCGSKPRPSPNVYGGACLSVPPRHVREPGPPQPPEPNYQGQPDPPEGGQESSRQFGPIEPDGQDPPDQPESDRARGPQPPDVHTIPQVCLSVTSLPRHRPPREP